MGSNLASETIEILRRALSDFEREIDPIADAVLLKQLKRIMLTAIAELELVAIRETQNGAPAANETKLDMP